MHFTKPDVQKRVWGSETTLVTTATHCGKLLKRKMDTKGGFQCHVKEESHYVIDGVVYLEWVEDGTRHTRTVYEGEGWTVPPFTFHRETALTDCLLVEVSDPTKDDRYGLVADALPNMTDQQAADHCDALVVALEERANQYRQYARQIRDTGLQALVPKGLRVDA